ncbi:MAG: hypothetical protein FJ147_17520 [Deltaproteobacteria bacterium]|nr:hypothetical protein [Deltaproteobacteria bacterium]
MILGVGEFLLIGIVIALSVFKRDELKSSGGGLNATLRNGLYEQPVFSATGAGGNEAEFIDDKLYDRRLFFHFILLVFFLVITMSLFIHMLR